MKKLSISISLLIALACMNFVPLHAAAPTCQYSGTTPYCQYTGKVKIAYINYANTILVYFDTPMEAGEPEKVGFSATTLNAAALPITAENEVFAKTFYATVLTALASNKTVGIQMRGNYGGYLKMDRIWLHKD